MIFQYTYARKCCCQSLPNLSRSICLLRVTAASANRKKRQDDSLNRMHADLECFDVI